MGQQGPTTRSPSHRLGDTLQVSAAPGSEAQATAAASCQQVPQTDVAQQPALVVAPKPGLRGIKNRWIQEKVLGELWSERIGVIELESSGAILYRG